MDFIEVLAILGRGVAKLLGFRGDEGSQTLEAGQSIVAAIIVVGIIVATLVALGWLLVAA